MKDTFFGFAIIGTGAIAEIHAKAIEAIPNARLVGVFNRTHEKAVAFGEKHACKAYESIDDLLTNSDVHIVCICTASGLHRDPALKAIAAGKHCIIEKPLEVTLQKSDEIIEAAREKGVKVAVIYPTRFYPASQHIRTAIDENRFGSLVLGSAYVKWSRDEAYYASADWRGTWEFDGGGALMNQAIHSVDILQWYMGPVESVQAIVANVRHKNIEVEDTAVAILKFKNGAVGTIECSTAVYPGTFKKIEVMGTKGSAIIEENSLVQWQFADENEKDQELRDMHAGGGPEKGGVANPMDIGFYGHQKQIEDLMAAISENREPLVNGEEGRKSVAIVRAVYESAQSGKPILIT
ncbi:Gfo/Idh/MocA family protein [Albibacterium profundi]|uniref:Gfo/Idh/MocA family oxidoreductase n=1 Tax=Albibacterium profundi TaxID=3134906 RepID=A0ABV5CHA1_9SPHI